MSLYICMTGVNLQNVSVQNPNGMQNVRQIQPMATVSNEIMSQTAVKPYKAPQHSTNTIQPVRIRTSLVTRQEKKQYADLSKELDLKYRKKLEYALKYGQLLKNNSNDGSTVLDNLHKIITEERDQGLDKVTLLKECLDILTNPYVITQTCEDIPKEYQNQVIGLITGMSQDRNVVNKAKYELNNMHASTCPAASIEFDLATKHTAEFFRIVEGLTSPRHAVVKTIRMNSLSEKSSDAIWLLNKFKTPFKMNGFDTATILLKPDENAYIRARIQNHHRDKGERSIIDVLMQSTLMQLGSQQTYNSLVDKRAPNTWTSDDSGLIEFEKTYVESVVEDKNTTSVTYQKLDQNGRLVGYEKDFATIKREILDTLKMGHNVIIGYTFPDPYEKNGKLAGHEITIVDYQVKPNGEGVFICQDSDDDKDSKIEMSEKYLLPKIHHAGLPDVIASRDFKYEDSWQVGVDEFSNLDKNNKLG